MNKSQLVINTLVYADCLKNKIPQSALLPGIARLGVLSAEIRREYIQKPEEEFFDIRYQAGANCIRLFYSVPEALFQNEQLRKEHIEQYFREAQAMGCSHVKMIIGDYGTFKKESADALNRLCDFYKIRLTVENDQTMENGTAEVLEKFLTEANGLGANVGMTFDIGNFLWVGEDPAENAKRLNRFVNYIHLKDAQKGNPPRTVLLGRGDIDLSAALAALPANVPVALEYPCGGDTEEVLKQEIEAVCSF